MKKKNFREWKCPQCGNEFGWEDGIRYCTRSSICPCNEMPLEVIIHRLEHKRPIAWEIYLLLLELAILVQDDLYGWKKN
jgi:hypothetical protein